LGLGLGLGLGLVRVRVGVGVGVGGWGRVGRVTCTPIMKRAPKKQGKPPHMPGGGTTANMSFHGTWVGVGVGFELPRHVDEVHGFGPRRGRGGGDDGVLESLQWDGLGLGLGLGSGLGLGLGLAQGRG
jgi:hypothetical protein